MGSLRKFTGSLFFLAVIFLSLSMTGCKRTDPDEIIVYFMNNYSYDWVSLKAVDPSLIEKCELYYKEVDERGRYDGMIIKRVYKVDYLEVDYLIFEFEFEDVTDSRVCLIMENSSKTIIGHFGRSLA